MSTHGSRTHEHHVHHNHFHTSSPALSRILHGLQPRAPELSFTSLTQNPLFDALTSFHSKHSNHMPTPDTPAPRDVNLMTGHISDT